MCDGIGVPAGGGHETIDSVFDCSLHGYRSGLRGDDTGPEIRAASNGCVRCAAWRFALSRARRAGRYRQGRRRVARRNPQRQAHRVLLRENRSRRSAAFARRAALRGDGRAMHVFGPHDEESHSGSTSRTRISMRSSRISCVRWTRKRCRRICRSNCSGCLGRCGRTLWGNKATLVVPAKARIHFRRGSAIEKSRWVPAFAGTTVRVIRRGCARETGRIASAAKYRATCAAR